MVCSGLAALALINTHAAAAAGLTVWVVIDAIRGHISISGACVGPIVGLVAVTPACGFVQPGWALFIGAFATAVIYGLLLLKRYMRVDDTLDVAIVHGCGRALSEESNDMSLWFQVAFLAHFSLVCLLKNR